MQGSGPATNTIVGPGSAAAPSQETIHRHMAEFQHFAQEQRAFRQSMLAALTPEHRQLLAQIASDLVIAPNPDLEGASRRLDAALSPG